MKVGSLFSGIGGLDLGLERAGMKVRWQVEKDEFCRKVLTKHWPDVEKHRNIRSVDEKSLDPVQVIAGGFPCQPISRAGKRRAQDDPRWLWPEFARILRGLHPKWVIGENVSGLTKRGLGDILSDLASLGYYVEWDSITASHFGAPHRRERVFIVAYANCFGRQPSILRPWEVVRDEERDKAVSQARWKDIEYRSGKPVGGGIESTICGVDDGITNRVDRIKALGNAVVPQIAEWVGRRIMKAELSE